MGNCNHGWVLAHFQFKSYVFSSKAFVVASVRRSKQQARQCPSAEIKSATNHRIGADSDVKGGKLVLLGIHGKLRLRSQTAEVA